MTKNFIKPLALIACGCGLMFALNGCTTSTEVNTSSTTTTPAITQTQEHQETQEKKVMMNTDDSVTQCEKANESRDESINISRSAKSVIEHSIR